MHARKFRLVFCMLFALAVTVSSATAQAQTTGDESAKPGTIDPTTTTLRLHDGGDDIAGRMTVDASGNFYVSAGINSVTHLSGFAVLKYSFNGKLQKVFRHKLMPGEFGGSAQSVKLDKQNNTYAIGSTSFGGLVASFTSSGAERWANRFDVEPVALAVDSSGNIYVAGNGSAGGSDGVGPILDWLVVKYSSNGKVLWEQRHTGTPGEDSKVQDIQLDASGNPIVFGTTSINPANLTNTVTVAKFDPQGGLLWAKDFSVPHNSQVAGGFAIDGGGNVYASSTTNPPEGIATPFTVKYDPNGVLQFVLQGNGAGGTSVAVDPNGDILLTGATSSFGTLIFVAATKIDPSGKTVWITRVPATGKIVPDSAGNAFVAGLGFTITKLNPSGRILFSSSILPSAIATDAVVDSSGNLLATGFAQNAQLTDDIVTVRLK